MKISTITYLSLSILLLGLIQTPVKGATIDLFSDVEDDVAGEQSVKDTSANNSAVNDLDSNLTDVLGGKRTISVSKTLPKNNSQTAKFAEFTIDPTPGTQEASFSATASTAGTFSILWNGDFDGAGSNDYIDLTENGDKDAFQINITTNDLGVKLKFDVTKTDNTVATYTTDPAITAGTLGNFTIPFASFSNSSAFQQAKSIKLSSSSEPTELDFSFTLFQTTKIIPFEFSPSLGIIIGGGFLGLHTLRKKIKASRDNS
jgi:hypothetical protein